MCIRDSCITGDDEECPFCKSMNSQFENKDDSTPKLVHKCYAFATSGYRGCEQNNLIIHFDYAYSGTPSFECFSRARQNLIVIISKSILEENHTFQNTIKEILTHDQKCENEKCQENEWTKLKFVDVEYIGLT